MNKAKYAEWIRESRGKTKQEEFGRKICRYKVIDGRKVCAHYHRNEVGNWERGKNLPMNAETVLSIALFSYDRQNGSLPVQAKDRNERLFCALRPLQEFLGIELYSRSVHDALLIQVCRGIITFEEVPELEMQLEAEINGPNIPKWTDTELSRASLRHQTESIRNELYRINSPEEIRETVLASGIYFKTANRVLGERLEEMYKSRKRYPTAISLESAVYIYAPNNRQTYRRIYQSSGITREWLLDLCRHLRFDRKETNYVLRNAQMAELPEEPEPAESDPDMYYKEYLRKPVGERLRIMVLIASLVFPLRPEEFPPADYVLESFTHNEQGKKALALLNSLIDGSGQNQEELYLQLEDKLVQSEVFQTWSSYILSGRDYAQQEGLQVIWRDHKDEHREYFRPYYSLQADANQRKEISLLHYLTALFYTVLTGKFYKGEHTPEDRLSVERQFMKAGAGYAYTGSFFNYILETFLNPRPCAVKKKSKDGGRWTETSYYFRNDRNSKGLRKEVNSNIIREDLWATVLLDK